jgi:hypothetical protein
MDELLTSLTEGLSPEDQRAVEEWWAALPAPTRAALAPMFDPRGDSCSFVPVRRRSGSWRWCRLLHRVDWGRVEQAEEPDTSWDWQYLEYQLTHPETYPVVLFAPRVFYIGGVKKVVAA